MGAAALVGHVLELGQQQLVVAVVRPVLRAERGPDQRADSTPGIPLRASTQSPESSAIDGSPVAASPARALSRALPSNVGWSSTGSSYAVDVVEPEHLDVGQVLAQDPLHLGELLGVAGRQEDLAHEESASCWSRVRSAQPFSPRASSASSSARENAAPSAVPCTSTNEPAPVITMFMSVSARTSSS